jgi:hypothetical protein
MAAKQRLDQHDTEIAAIRKLIAQGMKMLVEFRRENRAARRELRAAKRKPSVN